MQTRLASFFGLDCRRQGLVFHFLLKDFYFGRLSLLNHDAFLELGLGLQALLPRFVIGLLELANVVIHSLNLLV